ncbi:MAG: serine/threonine protein kinase, partial [Polyangiaceae bacterium]
MPLEPGSRLDRYELLCPIAHGGMALVWLARLVGKHGFEKLVAIKTILPEFAADTRFQQMFLDEARIASGIEHVNVAQILDLGEQHDILYIVMEWVDGDSLSKLHRAVERRGERIPLGILLRIVADACGGLHTAHDLTDKTGRALGVVHRDVSPQNILVSSKGNAKLIDFGIAKALVRLSGETNAGLLKGKIQYMAPEQAMGRPLDRRADVWAAGACLYYLLSGVPPFDGENQLATLHLLT